MRRLAHKPVALAWRQRREPCPLRGSGCRNLVLPDVYEQALPFPSSYPTFFLLNLTHTTHQNVTNSIHCLLSGEFFLNTHETKERINADVHSTGNAPPRDYEPFSSMARFEKLKS